MKKNALYTLLVAPKGVHGVLPLVLRFSRFSATQDAAIELRAQGFSVDTDDFEGHALHNDAAGAVAMVNNYFSK
jgi:hypothetical protein